MCAPPFHSQHTLQEVVLIASNQEEARRRAQVKLRNAQKSGAKQRDVDRLKAAVDAAQAKEDRGRTGGHISRIFGW